MHESMRDKICSRDRLKDRGHLYDEKRGVQGESKQINSDSKHISALGCDSDSRTSLSLRLRTVKSRVCMRQEYYRDTLIISQRVPYY